MKTIVNKLIYTLAIITSLMICSCTDDFPNVFGEIPEGDGNLTATVTFTPTLGANLNATRTAGDVIQTINSLCVLVYTSEDNGNLVRKYNQEELVNYDTSEKYVVKKDDHLDGNEAHTDEVETAQATFTIPDLPYGRYKIYAVANMGDMTGYEDKIQTEEGLRNISLNWQTGKISANNQMFGFFTPYENMESKGLAASPIVFSNTETKKIHAWLKRAASKVTVAFNPSGLNQDVNVYIKSVTIRDIPKACLLGYENTPTQAAQLYNHLEEPYNVPNFTVQSNAEPNTRFYYDSKGIIMSNGDDPQPITTWDKLPSEVQAEMSTNKKYGLLLSNGTREYIPKDSHTPTAQALFFYENNQMKEEYKNNILYNKHPQLDSVGAPIRKDENNNDFKDRVKYGTYIEVEAYYISANPQKVGEGSIKYRFMLGKDIDYDYNAQRNYHFKLTLGFNGWANEPDWHIDYEQPETGLEVPPVFRVSYLYYQKSELPIRLYGNCTKLEVTIKENNWAPYDPTNPPDSVPPAGVSSVDPNPTYAFQWNSQAYYSTAYFNPTTRIEDPAFGFLALHLPDINKKTIITEDYSAGSNTQLKNYYRDNDEGYREFVGAEQDLKIGAHPAGNHDSYVVTPVYDASGKKELANQKTLLLPVWTRAKSLIEDSGFSGNNPYEGYERKAVLEIRAEFDGGPNVQGGSVHTKTVKVLQVKRLVNPKGVWRDKNESQPFDVTLLEAINANGMSNFQEFTSEGEWSAYIEGASPGAGFSLNKHPKFPDNCYLSQDGDTIHGYSNTTINFRINFRGDVGENSECAIVKVLYHGNQCLHKILVRKGYDQPIEMGGNSWSSFSLYQATYRPGSGARGSGDDIYDAVLTKNPLMLGSMFRRGRQDYGILVKNNMESEGGVGPLLPPGQNFQYMVANEQNGVWERRTWGGSTPGLTPTAGIIGYRNDVTDATGRGSAPTAAQNQLPLQNRPENGRGLGTFITDDGTVYKVPSFKDWWDLTYDSDTEFGFGVVYGSAATEPQTEAENAYGLIDPDNTGEFTDKRGMRGIIVYQKVNGNQIFFPAGKYGTGRRSMFNVQRIPTSTGSQADPNYYGVLRYADVYAPLSIVNSANNLYRPIPYNLPIASGNVYWIDKYHYDVRPTAVGFAGTGCLGWDLNYFNFDFNAYTANNYQDACPIKLIIVNNN